MRYEDTGALIGGTSTHAWHFHLMEMALRFLEGFFSDPRAVGSPLASGRTLANAIAGQIALGAARVLELGPGTGAVTAAILARGTGELCAIECNIEFSELLRGRFPDNRILHGDAFSFDRVLTYEGMDAPFDAIVSGVPVLNRSKRVRRELLRKAMNWLKPGAPFIQYSYAVTSPFPDCAEIERAQAAKVWWNIPPLQVWVYRQKQA